MENDANSHTKPKGGLLRLVALTTPFDIATAKGCSGSATTMQLYAIFDLRRIARKSRQNLFSDELLALPTSVKEYCPQKQVV